MKINKQTKKGLSISEKRKMFFFGVFLVLMLGTRIFYNLPGNKKQKKEILIFYFLSLFFWIIVLFLGFFILNFFLDK